MWLFLTGATAIVRLTHMFMFIKNEFSLFGSTGEHINGDKALRAIVRRLSNHTRNVSCPEIERVMLSDGCRVTDKGLELLSRRCPQLTHLQIPMSFSITNQALYQMLTKCVNIQHLDVSGMNCNKN